MGWFSPDMQTMKDLFLHSMQDIYYAEHQIEKALPEMVEKASDTELKKGFRTHLKQTKGQIKRLDQAFKKLRVTPQGTKCPAIDGIIDEAQEIAGEIADKMVLNAALIAAAQAVGCGRARRELDASGGGGNPGGLTAVESVRQHLAHDVRQGFVGRVG